MRRMTLVGRSGPGKGRAHSRLMSRLAELPELHTPVPYQQACSIRQDPDRDPAD